MYGERRIIKRKRGIIERRKNYVRKKINKGGKNIQRVKIIKEEKIAYGKKKII